VIFRRFSFGVCRAARTDGGNLNKPEPPDRVGMVGTNETEAHDAAAEDPFSVLLSCQGHNDRKKWSRLICDSSWSSATSLGKQAPTKT
jgi:hypothetical protein